MRWLVKREAEVVVGFRKPLDGMGSTPMAMQGISGGYNNVPSNGRRQSQTRRPSRQSPPQPVASALSTPQSSYNNNQVFKLDNNPSSTTKPQVSSTTVQGMEHMSLSGPSRAGGGGGYKERFSQLHGESDGQMETTPSSSVNLFVVVFKSGSMGLTLEEVLTAGTKYPTAVSRITQGGQADKLGIKLGDMVAGFAEREAISHGMVVAGLKYREGDVKVKFFRSS